MYTRTKRGGGSTFELGMVSRQNDSRRDKPIARKYQNETSRLSRDETSRQDYVMDQKMPELADFLLSSIKNPGGGGN